MYKLLVWICLLSLIFYSPCHLLPKLIEIYMRKKNEIENSFTNWQLATVRYKDVQPTCTMNGLNLIFSTFNQDWSIVLMKIVDNSIKKKINEREQKVFHKLIFVLSSTQTFRVTPKNLTKHKLVKSIWHF